MELCEALAAGTYCKIRAHKAQSGSAFERFRFAICYVEYGGHAVAVLRRESAGGKGYVANHVGVDDTQTFLLSGADELRAIDFYAVDVHTVFVVCSATDVVLARHLVVRAYAGHCCQ